MTKTEVLHLANLSKLEFSDTAMDSFLKEFETILEFVSAINKVEISQEAGFRLVSIDSLRDDIIKPSFDREALLTNAPSTDGECFVVPQVVE